MLQLPSFFDPIGMWELVKLQLKLKLVKVSKLSWNEHFEEIDQVIWKDTLARLTEYGTLERTGAHYP